MESQLNRDDNGFDDIQGRIKGFGFLKRPALGQQQNGRLFFGGSGGSGASAIKNPLFKTVTLLVTSTCTALTMISCIPAADVLSPVACARKRQISENMFEEHSPLPQFPITPTKVQMYVRF